MTLQCHGNECVMALLPHKHGSDGMSENDRNVLLFETERQNYSNSFHIDLFNVCVAPTND
jgi:hypothetical protein